MTYSSRNPERIPCVYILASRRNGTLYIGVTSDLVQRVWQHKNDFAEGFTKRYGVHRLVWYAGCKKLIQYRERTRVEGASHPVPFQIVPMRPSCLLGLYQAPLTLIRGKLPTKGWLEANFPSDTEVPKDWARL